MGNILVLYHSNTGNTATMARYVAEGAAKSGEHDVRLRTPEDANADDLRWCHGIALGTPTNYGSVSWQMKRWFDELPSDLWSTIDGKIGCSFSSAGGVGGGTEINCMTLLTMLMNFGFLVFGVTDYVDKQLTLHYGATVAGEPRSEKEIEICRRLGERLAEWVTRYFG